MDDSVKIAPKYTLENGLIVNKATGAYVFDVTIDQLPLLPKDYSVLAKHPFSYVSELLDLAPNQLSTERKVYDRIGRAVRVYLDAKEAMDPRHLDYQKTIVPRFEKRSKIANDQKKESTNGTQEDKHNRIIEYRFWNEHLGIWEEWIPDDNKDSLVNTEYRFWNEHLGLWEEWTPSDSGIPNTNYDN